MSRITVLEGREVRLDGYGTITIEEDMSGGWRIKIDAISDDVRLGFHQKGGTSFYRWKVVQKLVNENYE